MDPELFVQLAQRLGPELSALSEHFNVLNAATFNLGQRFDALVLPLEAWAKALSPATANSFDLAMRNLTATLGQAVVPTFGLLTSMVDRFAGIISPVAQALAEPLHHVAELIGGRFLDAVRLVADIIKARIPNIEAFLSVMDDLFQIIRAVQIVLRSAVNVWDSMLGSVGKTKGAADYLKDAFAGAARQVILFTARLAAAFGATGFLDALIKNLKAPGDEQGALAAPQNVRIQDFASISRDMIQAAFAAGPGGEQGKEAKDYLRDLIPIIEGLRDGNQNMFAEFNKVIGEINFHLGLIYDLTSQTTPNLLDGISAVNDINTNGIRVIGKVLTGPG